MTLPLLVSIKPLAKRLQTRVGQRLNLWMGRMLMQQPMASDPTRIAGRAHQHLVSLGYTDHCYKTCLQTEAQCLRAEASYGPPNAAWAGVLMPTVRPMVFQWRRNLLAPLHAARRHLQRWESSRETADQSGKAGLFQGMSYRFRSAADLSPDQPEALVQLSAQSKELLKTYAQIAESRSGQGSIGILISCFRPEEFIPGFLTNLQELASPQRLVPVFINAGMSEACAESIRSFLDQADFGASHVLHRPGSGIYEAWNQGIQTLGASVEFITNFNVDDRRHPLCLEIQAEYLNAFTDKQVAVTDYIYFFEQCNDLNRLYTRNFFNRTLIPTVNQRTLLDHNYPHASPLWRRSLHQENQCGLFDETYRSAGDAEFWYRVSRIHPHGFGVISLPLSLYYQNPHGLSTRPQTIGLSEHQRCSKDHYRFLIDQIDQHLDPEFARQYIPTCSPEHQQILSFAACLK